MGIEAEATVHINSNDEKIDYIPLIPNMQEDPFGSSETADLIAHDPIQLAEMKHRGRKYIHEYLNH